MEKFIYVFDTAARDRLLEAGFLLLKADADNAVYVFSNDEPDNCAEALAGLTYVKTNTLSF